MTRKQRITYRQVLTRSFVVLVAAYLILGYWSVYTPGRSEHAHDRTFNLYMLILTEIVAPIAAALTALALSTVWWLCRLLTDRAQRSQGRQRSREPLQYRWY